MTKDQRVIVVGLDGATWDLIGPWVEQGKLPTFKKMMKEGIWGELESTMPPVTAPAWASFLTGRNPGKTGIYDFLYLREAFPPKTGVSSGSMIRENNLLTILSKHGFKVASINIPMTYPPYEVNGSLITGVETPEGRKFAYPDELYEKLLQEDYFPEPELSYAPRQEEKYLNDLHSMIEKRNKILFDFLKDDEFDLLLFLFRETDLVSHTFWRYMDENHPLHPYNNRFRESIFKIYKRADHLLKVITEKRDKSTLLIVMSDHGFGPEYYRVNMNNWLLKKGHISLKSDLRTVTKRLVNRFISPSKGWNFVNMFGLKWLRKTKTKQTRIGEKGLASKLFAGFDDVDWEQTAAYSIGCIGRHLPIFIKSERVETYSDKIVKDIFSLNEHLGRRVIKKVLDTRDIYTKNNKNILPDLFVEFEVPYAGYTLAPPYIFEDVSVISTSPITQSGTHKTAGILVAVGPSIRNGKIRKASITDIAPTLLAFFDIEPMNTMDGGVLPELLGSANRNLDAV